MIKELTVKEFESWLTSFDDDRIVGEGCSAGNCPIANYYWDQDGVRDVEVTGDYIHVNWLPEGKSHWPARIMPTKKWQKDFIDELDTNFALDVDAKDALLVLGVTTGKILK
jgi:hypothetical protein